MIQFYRTENSALDTANLSPYINTVRETPVRSSLVSEETQPPLTRLAHTSNKKPRKLTDRASPYPEVTDLICRLPLGTLFRLARGY